MSDTVIQVDNVWKKYQLGVLGTGTLSHDLNRWWHRVRGKPDPYEKIGERSSKIGDKPAPTSISPLPSPPSSESNKLSENEMWALQGVSFEVKQGEILGIVGRNGAGKSTLLKILSRVTAPTSGEVRVKGRIASLLEVGTGFHPELTGRENIFLNGTILGMTKGEIKTKLDEIIAFAEIEKFINTPVKRYSSGMYVRLAFAVAAHLEPEILIVDEVLAVGDAAFQKKCLGKMGQVSLEGRTVILVSHNMQVVSTLTRQSIFLSQGRCVGFGPTSDVVSEYLKEGVSDNLIYVDSVTTSDPKVTRVELHTSEAMNTQHNGESMEVLFEICAPAAIKGASLSFQVCTSMGQPIMHLWTFDSERPMCREAGIFQVICRIPSLRLYMGRYTLIVHFAEAPGGKKFQTIEGICPFEVVMYKKYLEREWQSGTCAYLEDCNWLIEKVELKQGHSKENLSK